MDCSVYTLFSLLQKSCRRGLESKALDAAFQLDAEYAKPWTRSRGGAMWSILRRITAEDISLANPDAGEFVEVQWRFWQKQVESLMRAKSEPHRLFTVTAVLYLCRSPKSRITDHAVIAINKERMQEIISEWRENPRPLVLPPYVYDGIHCSGPKKTEAEFILTENAVLQPRAEIDDPYIRQITSALNFH